MDDKPFSSSLEITLCTQPKVVAGLSHTLIPTLDLPLPRVNGGVVVVTSNDRVGEEGAVWTGGRAKVLAFLSLSFLFFESEVKWAKGSFFKFLMRAYLYLLYLVAIFVKKKKKKKKDRQTYSFLIDEFFPKHIFEGSGPKKQSYK